MLVKITDRLYLPHDQIIATGINPYGNVVVIDMIEGKQYLINKEYGKPITKQLDELVFRINLCYHTPPAQGEQK